MIAVKSMQRIVDTGRSIKRADTAASVLGRRASARLLFNRLPARHSVVMVVRYEVDCQYQHTGKQQNQDISFATFHLPYL